MKAWVCIFIAALLSAQTVVFAADFNEFHILAWGKPQHSGADAIASAIADAGLTLVMWDADKLDTGHRHGLKVMLHHPDPADIPAVADHPALWGYYIVDEPYPEDTYDGIAEEVRKIRDIDPNHPCFINMLSITGDFLEAYMRTVRPEILSFDFYQWFWGRDRFYEKLEQFREMALLHRVPLGSCIETTSNPLMKRVPYPEDNPVKLRQSVYSNLAYGVKIIEWYPLRHIFKENSTELTENGRDVVALNREMNVMAPYLARFRSTNVFHTPPLPIGTRETYTEHWLRPVGEEGTAGVLMGTFKDETLEGDEYWNTDYIMLVNRDYHRSQNVELRFQTKWLGKAPWHPPKIEKSAVYRLDKTTGEWQTIRDAVHFEFLYTLAPGDGELFKIVSDVKLGTLDE